MPDPGPDAPDALAPGSDEPEPVVGKPGSELSGAGSGLGEPDPVEPLDEPPDGAVGGSLVADSPDLE